MNNQAELNFTLDIGTRTVIGIICKPVDTSYHILASRVVEHTRRAMLDGQIHNVREVTRIVKQVKDSFEEELGIGLEKVSIAAAGRSLETICHLYEIELENRRLITAEDIHRLEFSAVQQAQTILSASSPENTFQKYHFVGYSVIEYRLDDMFIGDLEGQTGKKLTVEIIATFLPRIVIDSLLSVINQAGLKVDYLTLEPIAAAGVVIPRDMYGFNLALVDIGAGTSDIALTSKGAMVGYAMVPVAGDEITEALADHFLLDYQTGEGIKRQLQGSQTEYRAKNILSQEVTITREEALAVVKPVVQSLAAQIAEAILSLNQKSPRAVICVGGGGLTPGLLSALAEALGIDPARVDLKKYEDVKNISGEIEGVNSSQAVTPIGIAVTSLINRHRANFLEVRVNDRPLQLFTIERATVADALLAADIDFKVIQGKNGKGLTCKLNGELKTIKGNLGKPGRITLNQEDTGLESFLREGDQIVVEPGKNGQDAAGTIRDVIPELASYIIFINDKRVELKPRLRQNGRTAKPTDSLLDGADIEYTGFNTIRDGLAFYYQVNPEEIVNSYLTITLNGKKRYLGTARLLVLESGKPVDIDRPLSSGLHLQVKESRDSLSIEKILPDNKLEITLNGRELSIPAGMDVYRNGEEIEGDYQLKDEDEISFKTRQITVQDVFAYLNYKIPDNLNKFLLTINEKKAEITEHLRNGDHLKIDLK